MRKMGKPQGIPSILVASLDNHNRFWQTLFSMKRPLPYRFLDTRRIHFRPMILVCIGIPMVVAVSWLTVRLISDRTLLKKLPIPPNLADHHPSLASQILRLDAEVRANPRSVEKIGALGRTYHANQSFNEARACYRLAVDLSPTDYRWPYYLAIIEEASGDEDRSINLLNHVTQLEPSYVHAWARLGNLLRRSSRIVEAKAALSRARTLDPAHPHACLGLARIAARQDDWKGVIRILEPMLKSHPLFAPALRLLSRAYVQIGRKPLFEEGPDTQIQIEDVIDEPLLDALYERSALALIRGDPNRGSLLLKTRCSRCHKTDRIQQADKSPVQWLHTVGRMQGQAGRERMTDSEAADILSYLVNRRH